MLVERSVLAAIHSEMPLLVTRLHVEQRLPHLDAPHAQSFMPFVWASPPQEAAVDAKVVLVDLPQASEK